MKNLTSNLTLAAAVTLALASLAGQAQAQDAKPAETAAPTPEHVVAYNVALTTDYRFRGVSQSRLKPAVSGGADYTHNPSGLYVGTWLSSIKWIKDSGGDSDLEWDVYGGKRGEIAEGISYDVGGLYYYYPSNKLATSANTFELYGQVGFGPAYLKYSHSTTNLFGFSDSKNSGYLDAGLNYDVYDGYTLNLHVGHQTVKHNSGANYTDYKIGVTKDYGVVVVALAVIKGDLETPAPTNGKDLAKTGLILTVSKSF